MKDRLKIFGRPCTGSLIVCVWGGVGETHFALALIPGSLFIQVRKESLGLRLILYIIHMQLVTVLTINEEGTVCISLTLMPPWQKRCKESVSCRQEGCGRSQKRLLEIYSIIDRNHVLIYINVHWSAYWRFLTAHDSPRQRWAGLSCSCSSQPLQTCKSVCWQCKSKGRQS